jgi:hypothetical protein
MIQMWDDGVWHEAALNHVLFPPDAALLLMIARRTLTFHGIAQSIPVELQSS